LSFCTHRLQFTPAGGLQFRNRGCSSCQDRGFPEGFMRRPISVK
jgi:hypothetical protein